MASALSNSNHDRRSRTAPTIRSRLALLAFACIVPAGLAVVTLLAYNYEKDRESLVRDSIATARAMTFAVDRDLAGVQAALKALATSPALASDDLASFRVQAEDALKDLNANNIVLIDQNGHQLLNTLAPIGALLPTTGNPPQLKAIFDADRPVVTDIFIGRVTGRPVIAIGVPVHRGGKVVYSLNAGIWPDRLARVLTQQRLPDGWIGAVFDGSGTIVARTHEMERFVGKKGAPALVQRMSQVAEDSLETNTVEGIPVVSVFSRSNVSNWTVAIGIPKSSLINAAVLSAAWLLLGILALLAAGLGLAWVIGGRIAGSIQNLTAPALALGEGKEIAITPLGLKEADDVAAALMKTSEKLQSAQHQALHDPLTDLPNRTLLSEFLDQQTDLSHRTKGSFALLCIDLDGFKNINDRYGHLIGDRLLCAVAERIKRGIRESDIPARMGGDEFAVVLMDTGSDGAARIGAKLVHDLSMPYEIGTLQVRISVSIGIAVYPETSTVTQKLLLAADEAMYAAKNSARERYVLARSPIRTLH